MKNKPIILMYQTRTAGQCAFLFNQYNFSMDVNIVNAFYLNP